MATLILTKRIFISAFTKMDAYLLSGRVNNAYIKFNIINCNFSLMK